MPKPALKQEILGRYYRWLIGQRNGVYFADGRSNVPSLGRQTLETRDRDQALKNLEELDLTMAVRHGLADAQLLKTKPSQILSWAEGRRLYEGYIQRPRVAGGPRKSTFKRYRAVLDKFIAYAEGQKRRTWNDVNRQLLDGYAAWLDGESYAYATEYLELTTLKQIVKFLVDNQHLPANTLLHYPLKKPDGTDTYCWKPTEVAAILRHCETPELAWLRHVVIGLAATGLRISELASLRWSDVNFERGLITLRDETTRNTGCDQERRTTKSGRDRTFPIQDSLREVLQSLPRHADGRVFHGPLEGKIKADTLRHILIRDVLDAPVTAFSV